MGDAPGERTERHTGLGGMTLFLTWQSAELNSRALIRRQAPLEEGCRCNVAGGLCFREEVVSARSLASQLLLLLFTNKGDFFPPSAFFFFVCSAARRPT